MANVFIVRPWAFDQPSVGRVNDEHGRELFGVFSYDDGDDEPPYLNYYGTRLDCNITARNWNDRLARGEKLPAISPLIRVIAE